jgi:hypothetical protein
MNNSNNNIESIRDSIGRKINNISEKAINKIASNETFNSTQNGWRGFNGYQLSRFTFSAGYERKYYVEE